jgi:uncharacterized phage protein (TIGR02218 family)
VRAASGGLIALLNSNTQFLVADLVTITQANGTITRLTNADFDIVANTFTFLASGPRFTRGKTKIVLGIVVDTMSLSIFADATQLLGGIPWPRAAAAGALDGARVLVERAHMATWGDTSVGTVILFSGRVSEINPSRNEVALVVKSDLEMLDIQMPRNTIQPNCIHTLFDSGCALLKATFTIAGVVTAGSGASAILASALTQATGYFDLGTTTFTSGVLAGVTRSVKTYTNSGGVKTITPAIAFSLFGSSAPLAPANGDTFNVVPGCDKTQGTCAAKFTNLTHFRGYPYVPAPEKAKL